MLEDGSFIMLTLHDVISYMHMHGRTSNTVLIMRNTLHFLLTIHMIIEMLRKVQIGIVHKLEEASK